MKNHTEFIRKAVRLNHCRNVTEPEPGSLLLCCCSSIHVCVCGQWEQPFPPNFAKCMRDLSFAKYESLYKRPVLYLYNMYSINSKI